MPHTFAGGTGADQFVFYRPDYGNDTIVDWSPGQHDKLLIDASGFHGGLAGGVALGASHLVQGTAATAATGQFLYDAVSGQLWWDADGTGSHAAVRIAILGMAGGLHPAALATSDFHIFA